MSIFLSHNETETDEWAFAFGKSLKAGDVVTLDGELGAGKTAICRGICAGLGFEKGVNSPSYSILHEYPNVPPIFHLDLYRLKNIDDLYDIGFENFLGGSGVVLIEWANKFFSSVSTAGKKITHRISVKIVGESEREITVNTENEQTKTRKIFIGIGSNIEPRENRLAISRKKLLHCISATNDDAHWLKSGIYETAAWGFEEQAKFLNQVVSFESNKTPQELLDICKNIEKEMGREQREKWHEREIDLDLLYCGDEIVKSKNLLVPHPLISQREFVLVPLCEIAPDFIDPKLKKTVRKMLTDLKLNCIR
ncbi:hypothetical protein AGMMS49938_03010 [Fibrobacterales bacterium]|nr:hypothetical protein AGMMS49938_03010 [Fibrobacterales bacterium]